MANFSTDDTRDIAVKHADLALLGGPERDSQVRLGVSRSRGDLVYEVDSNFVLEPHVVAEAVETALDENSVAVVIPNLSDPTVSSWPKVRFFERLTYVGSDQIEAARFFRRDAYDKAGGHDPGMIAYEEYDLHNRISGHGKISRIHSVEWHVGEPRRLSEVVVKHRYYGKTMSSYVSRYPLLLASTQHIPVRRASLKNRMLFLLNPSAHQYRDPPIREELVGSSGIHDPAVISNLALHPACKQGTRSRDKKYESTVNDYELAAKRHVLRSL
jgi:hypothetical protein